MECDQIVSEYLRNHTKKLSAGLPINKNKNLTIIEDTKSNISFSHKFLAFSIIVMVVFFWAVFNNEAHAQDAKRINLVPTWVKHDVSWWLDREISDKEFLSVLKWLAENQIINVSTVSADKENMMTHIPDSARSISMLWLHDQVTDAEFLNQVRYMIKHVSIDKVGNERRSLSGNANDIVFPTSARIFITSVKENGTAKGVTLEVNPDESNIYKQISVWNETKKYAFVIPIFTHVAYLEPGYYTYYRGNCDINCLTKKIDTNIPLDYPASGNAVQVLSALGYESITDVDIDKNPEILKKYDKIVLLHNEYVTKREFDAITSHPNVIYLYPNALYAEVSTDYKTNTVTLVRGHSYPQMNIQNGFDWKFDNSKQEYDTNCTNWKFTKVINGQMLNCYPEFRILSDPSLLQEVKR